MRFFDVAEASEEVAQTRSRKKKTAAIARALRLASPPEAGVVAKMLAGELHQGKIGIGHRTVQEVGQGAAAAAPRLTVGEVDQALTDIQAIAGKGSKAARTTALGELMARCTEAERSLLRSLLVGGIRQGALEGIVVEGLAAAHEVSGDRVRRAVMLSGDLAAVAAGLAAQGPASLDGYRLLLMRPVQPMLAQTGESIGAAAGRFEGFALEEKLDGARVQAHKQGDEVRVFTRRLNECTDRVPEVVEAVRALRVDSAILDGEALALAGDGRPRPFQVTMRRFGRKLDVAQMREQLPLSVRFFDALHLDGDILDQAAGERFAQLGQAVPARHQVRRVLDPDAAAAEAFADEVLSTGHEGVMVKDLTAPYEAGRRGAGWLKVKPAHTLDLVVLAVEWGSGRRKGWLSNLHLGCRDPQSGGYVMLGKTFKGMTDEMLRWQTERFLALATEQSEWVVTVRPEVVVEIAFDSYRRAPTTRGGWRSGSRG